MFVCPFLIVSKKQVFPFVFVCANRRSGDSSKFQFLISANCGFATFGLQKVSESAGDIGVFSLLILLC